MTKFTKLVMLLFLTVSVIASTVLADEVKIQTNSHCEKCKDKIEKGLKKVSGVEKVELNSETKIVTINFDSKKTNPEALLKKVKKLGYEASFAGDDTKSEKMNCKHEMKHNCCKDMKDSCKTMSKEKCKEMKEKCMKEGKMDCKKDMDKCCKKEGHKHHHHKK